MNARAGHEVELSADERRAHAAMREQLREQLVLMGAALAYIDAQRDRAEGRKGPIWRAWRLGLARRRERLARRISFAETFLRVLAHELAL